MKVAWHSTFPRSNATQSNPSHDVNGEENGNKSDMLGAVTMDMSEIPKRSGSNQLLTFILTRALFSYLHVLYRRLQLIIFYSTRFLIIEL